jgi:glycosyltransferase involved in cell wall biosynthesis
MFMASQPKIVAAIPCFNEERFIGSVVAKTRKYVDEVIVIDDGSSDDSAEIAEFAGATVYRHESNLGYGAAICSCLEKGQNRGADILVTIDGDGQHDPKEIPLLIKPILEGQADVVVGSRFLNAETKSPLYRRVGQQVLNVATNVGSGHKLSDSQSGCRAYSAKALEELNLSETGMSVSSEIQFAIKRAGLRVSEVTISVSYEEGAKRNPVGHGMNVLTRVVILFILRHPLLFFGLPGIALLAGGLVIGLRVIDIYSETDNIAVGNALIAILLATGGFLTLFGGLILQAMKELLRGEASLMVKKMKGQQFK